MKPLLPVLFASVMLITGCDFSRSTRKTVMEREDCRIYIRRNTHAPEEGYDHPKDLTVGAMRTVFSSVKIEVYSLFQWKEPYPLFDGGEVRNLSRGVRKALQQAEPDDLIYWRITRPGRGYGKVLYGTVYIYRNNVYVTVEKARGQEWDPNRSMAAGTDTMEWRLRPGKLQRYRTKPGIAGPTPVENTVVTSMSKLAMIRGGVDRIGGDIMKKLKKLKELLDEGLITEDEHNEQRKRLLDEL